jgi:hypothetical protein
MSVVDVAEGTRLPRDEWVRLLGKPTTQFNFLEDARVFLPHAQGGFVLNFVGVVILETQVLFARPKFGQTSLFDMAGTLRILRSYFSRGSARKAIADRMRDPEYGNLEVLREFDALIGLQEWFQANGLYRRETSRETGHGRPHWVRTIARRPPLIMQGAVVYPTIVASRQESIFNDITALQVGVLARLMNRYGFEQFAAVRDAETIGGTVVTSWPMLAEQKAYFLRRLRTEQAGVYRTDTLQLLALLREVLDTQLASSCSQPHIFGTTAFYAVWEDACRTEIGGDIAPSKVAAMAQPNWITRNSDGEVQRDEHRQIPDVMVRHKDWLFIIDAKYYFPFPRVQPGAPDIVKQLYYAESVSHDSGRILSIFLIPIPNAARPKFLGYATIQGGMRSFAKIEAWGINPDWLFAGYPFRSAGCAQQMIDLVLQDRDSVAKLARQAPALV